MGDFLERFMVTLLLATIGFVVVTIYDWSNNGGMYLTGAVASGALFGFLAFLKRKNAI